MKSRDKLPMDMPSRRELLLRGGRLAGGLLVAPMLLDLASPTAAARPGGRAAALPGGDVLMGLYPRSSVPTVEAAVTQACAQLDFSWLRPGDSVLIKVASNSPNVHPATTSPAAVKQMVAELKARGAGAIYVGDQAGVQFVRLAEGEQRYGSTREVMASNGLLGAITSSGATAHFFDDQGYEAGYFQTTPPSGSHWRYPIYLPNIVQDVDHVVYMPRLSSHMIAGYTHAHKIAIGWLRDDSRYHLHHDASTFFQKYVEINYTPELYGRLRLIFTVADAFLLDQGPDVGTVATADPRVILASTHMANHDAVSVGLLSYIDDITPPDPDVSMYYGARSNRYNYALVRGIGRVSGIPWEYNDSTPRYTSFTPPDYQASIDNDVALQRGYEILGGLPSTIKVHLPAADPAAALVSAMQSWSGGLFTFV